MPAADRGYRVKLVHARSHVPAMMAAVLESLTGVPFLFDIRGLLAEEYVDAGVWPAEGLLYRTTKRMEKWLVGRSTGFVVLTRRAAALLGQWYAAELADKPLEVIPCCVDLRRMREESPGRTADLDHSAGETSLVYVGKLGGKYATRAMVDLFAAARRTIPELRWTVFSQSDSADLRSYAAAHGLDSFITIGRVERDSLLAEIRKGSAGLCLYSGDRSTAACSPTKIAEYLIAGLPVLASSGLGDVDRIILGQDREGPAEPASKPVGVLVDETDPSDFERAADELRRLLLDPDIRPRCRAAAEQHFDLEAIGWARYRRIYARLIGPPYPDGASPPLLGRVESSTSGNETRPGGQRLVLAGPIMNAEDFLIGIAAGMLLTILGLGGLYLSRYHRDTLPFQQYLFLTAMTIRCTAAAGLQEPRVYEVVIGAADDTGWYAGQVFKHAIDQSPLGPLAIPSEIVNALQRTNRGYGTVLGLYFYFSRLESQFSATVLSCFAGSMTALMAYRLARLIFSEDVACTRAGWSASSRR